MSVGRPLGLLDGQSIGRSVMISLKDEKLHFGALLLTGNALECLCKELSHFTRVDFTFVATSNSSRSISILAVDSLKE